MPKEVLEFEKEDLTTSEATVEMKILEIQNDLKLQKRILNAFEIALKEQGKQINIIQQAIQKVQAMAYRLEAQFDKHEKAVGLHSEVF